MVKGFTFVVALSSLAWIYWVLHQSSNQRAQLHSYIDAREGDTVCRPDRKAWNDTGNGAFVIAISGVCVACEAAKPLEVRIEDYGRLNGVPTFYVADADRNNNDLFTQLSAAGKNVFRVESLKFGANKVPTFMRVDDSGKIQAMWVGSPPESHRDEAFGLVTIGWSSRGYDIAPAGKLADYIANPDYQILALSDSGHRHDRAKVLPVKDLNIRARYELDPGFGVAIDCGSAAFASSCQEAALTLSSLKVKHVVAVGLSERASVCF